MKEEPKLLNLTATFNPPVVLLWCSRCLQRPACRKPPATAGARAAFIIPINTKYCLVTVSKLAGNVQSALHLCELQLAKLLPLWMSPTPAFPSISGLMAYYVTMPKETYLTASSKLYCISHFRTHSILIRSQDLNLWTTRKNILTYFSSFPPENIFLSM